MHALRPLRQRIRGNGDPPLLVWSRMYSMGKGHIFQGMYVVGEKMANDRKFDPDLAGIWLCNNTLDKVSDKNFAFYYDNEGKQGRIRHTDLREGTDGGKATGNPFLADKIEGYRTWKEAFPTPVCDMDESSGFSMTYSLSNQSTFVLQPNHEWGGPPPPGESSPYPNPVGMTLRTKSRKNAKRSAVVKTAKSPAEWATAG